MAQLKGGQAVVESLLANGVDTVFGIISAHMMEIYDALYDHTDSIRFIGTRHEHAAALMADGYARVTGKPGVCLTSSGPGAANSMGGMGEAYFASSPVLNITSTAEEGMYRRGIGTTHETKDQLGMFSAVTQWNCHVGDPEEIPDRIYEAFERFKTQRSRPIEIEIAMDAQGQVAEIELPQVHLPSPPGGDPTLVEEAARLLLTAKRAAVMAGNGVQRSGATGELVTLVERLGIPVFTTREGKGAVPDDHPLSMGVHAGIMGWSPGPLQEPLQDFLDRLDTILVVGSSLPISRTQGLDLRLPANLIHVDIDAASIGNVYQTSLGVVGDAGAVLRQLNVALQGKTSHLDKGFDEEVRELKERISRFWWQAMPNEMKTMDAIRNVVDRDAIFMGDVNIATHHGANNCLRVYEPRTYMISHWGGLGFAFPACVGAKAAFPNRQVVCLTGDGGFQFNIQELGTCIQYGLNPVVLVFNDDAWGVLRQRQSTGYNGRLIASDLKNPDFVKLAESYGANGVRAESIKELVPALERALRSDTVTLIEVPTPNGFENFT